MADTVTAEAARVRRVSDQRVNSDATHILDYGYFPDAETELSIGYPLDLRDERQASRDKDAAIADLGRRLAEDKAVYQRALTKAGQDLCEMASWMSRANDLQARLTEAEQRAATAERRGFDAGALVMREAAAREAFSLSGNGKIAAAIRFLAPAVPQEGETTP